jgi:UDP-2-acetamido-3-amino-2,3-dideoxy-glucuronate N-acetyltransferase
LTDFFVHETAVIDNPCRIGAGTRIWHFSHIMANSEIGERVNIGQNVVISPGCVIGNNCKIQNNVSIYTGVVLEEDVFCGPSMVFTNVVNPRAFIERKNEYRRTLVKRGASVGANATIVCGVTLGRYCFVGAGAVVTRDVPDYGTVYGNPARLHGWTCYCGVQLSLGVDPEQAEQGRCVDCGRVYQRTGLDLGEIETADEVIRK